MLHGRLWPFACHANAAAHFLIPTLSAVPYSPGPFEKWNLIR